MDLDQEIAEFLKENGLYASKTFFYLKSTHNISMAKILNSVKNRKFCNICSKEYFSNSCVSCQDEPSTEKPQKITHENTNSAKSLQHAEPGCSTDYFQKTAVHCECPLCFKKFPIGLIEKHAANCKTAPYLIDENDKVPDDEYFHLSDHDYLPKEKKSEKCMTNTNRARSGD